MISIKYAENSEDTNIINIRKSIAPVKANDKITTI